MARSREIGWGAVNIGLYTFDRDVSCECVPSGVTPVGCAPLWIEPLDVTRPNSPEIIIDFTNSFLDENCNVYAVGAYDTAVAPSYGTEQFIVKLNPNGTIAWQKKIAYSIEGLWNDFLIKKIRVDASGNVLVLYVNGLIKFDSSGNILWQVWYDAFFNVGPDLNLLQGFDMVILSDGTPVTLWITGDFNEERPFLATHNPATGAIVDKILLSVTPNPTYSFEDGAFWLVKDAADNVYTSMFLQNPQYVTVFFKLTNTLDLVWNKVTNVSLSTNLGDMDCYGLVIDSDGNLYSTSYEGEVIKIDGATGNTIWTKIPTADGFPYGRFFRVAGVTSDDELIAVLSNVILAFDKNGNFLWAYEIIDSTGSSNSNYDGQDKQTVRGKTLVWAGSYQIPGPYAGFYLSKIATIDMTGVVAGNYSFNAYTSVVSIDNSSNIVLSTLGLTELAFTPTPIATPYTLASGSLNVVTNTPLP